MENNTIIKENKESIEKYFRWWTNDKSMGGTINLELYDERTTFSFHKVSGSSIPTAALIELLWNHVSLAAFRDAGKRFERPSEWALGESNKMSGATDWYLTFLVNGVVKHSDNIIHSSSADKQNVDIECISIGELYDCLWAMKDKGLYSASFVNNDDTSFNYKDITEEILKTRNEFLKSCYSVYAGYSTICNN